ncbi:MAG: oxidoreductase [Rhodoferax sp.]|jgi:predicted dehydrogenase|uniref:oxidoreductase n=1 Tax=Rhodoferax sp. TaxID=50421 RepID=UPI001B5EEA55|nr:oxidoreductase [Rhodoferax sp.]MBP9149579.1 oxidoreductase [Rhodoferax sp.]MBP9734570.1 oxidoreductase [Rhodoferax sp.]
MTVNVALIGYGAAARIFHAPLIAGVPGLTLAVVCSSRMSDVLADWPQVQVLATPHETLNHPDVDLVVIATPNESHYPLALAALLAGKHVVVDKPCTVTLAQTEHLLQVARQQGRVLTVFQNRRLDSDFLALQQVLDSRVLGRVVEVNAHFDRYRPVVPQRWREQDQPGAGLWVDLGAHLVDQALQLWGVPDAFSLDLAVVRDGALVNDWFHAVLRYQHADGARRVILHASTLVAETGPRWVVHGTKGSFIKFGLDSQEDALKAGLRPQLDDMKDWGVDPSPGQLVYWSAIPGVNEPVCIRQAAPNPPGNYLDYYANLRDHLCGRAELMVTPDQVLQVMQMLTMGQERAQLGDAVVCGLQNTQLGDQAADKGVTPRMTGISV